MVITRPDDIFHFFLSETLKYHGITVQSKKMMNDVQMFVSTAHYVQKPVCVILVYHRH